MVLQAERASGGVGLVGVDIAVAGGAHDLGVVVDQEGVTVI